MTASNATKYLYNLGFSRRSVPLCSIFSKIYFYVLSNCSVKPEFVSVFSLPKREKFSPMSKRTLCDSGGLEKFL